MKLPPLFLLSAALEFAAPQSQAQDPRLPDFFRGVWSGTIIQIDPRGFPTFISLLGGNSGEPVGTNTTHSFFRFPPPHWALGNYALNEVIDQGHLKLEETFTQGNPIIIGGLVEFVRTDVDQFHYSWHSGTDSSAGDFTRLSTDADDLPADYHGIWSGWLVNGDMARAVRLTLTGSAVGTPVGVLDQMSGNCGGLVTLVEAQADHIQLGESQDYGPCPWSAGSLTASRLPSGNLAIDWENETEIYLGELSRSISPPGVTAAFTVDPQSGVAPLAVHFDGSISTSPPGTTLSSFSWDFGDGDSDVTQDADANHTFNEAGRFVVTLTAASSIGIEGSAQSTIQSACPGAPVPPFVAEDIGSLAFPGASRPEGDGFTLCTGGKRLTGKADSLHFVHRQISCSSFVFTAHLASAANESVLAQAGLMIREGLDPGARHACLAIEKLDPGDESRVRLVSRTVEGSATTNPFTANPLAPPAAWLRLSRDGDVIRASVSVDGANWDEDTFKPVTLEGLSRTIFLGFAGMGSEPPDPEAHFMPLEARFTEVQVEGCPLGSSFRRGDVDANGSIQITDPVRILGYLFLGEGSPECLEAADTDNDGAVDISDVIANLSYQFTGGESPAPPGPTVCGEDPQAPFLGCDQACP
jgi:regulation of enolase protein 1 (concanavalin A-like superfamily)